MLAKNASMGGRMPFSVLIASDSFKGSATSAEVAECLERGVRRAVSDALVTRMLVADGGEGTLDALVAARGGRIVPCEVTGPLGDLVAASWGDLGSGVAIVEMARAAGLGLVAPTPVNAARATTRGVGELILDAVRHGARKVYVGLGGSATSDAGAGAAQALGVRLLDARDREVGPGALGLADVARVDVSCLAPELGGVEVVLLTDVTNPLTGPDGAVRVFGPQKGLAEKEFDCLDGALGRYAALVTSAVGRDFSAMPGAGAAGGLGFGLMAFLGARAEHGVDAVLDASGMDVKLAGVDLVITGEGRMDAQTARGKAPVGVARRAKARGVPAIAVVGSRAENLDDVYDAGIDLVIPLPLGPCSLDECMARTRDLLVIAGETAARAFLLGK